MNVQERLQAEWLWEKKNSDEEYAVMAETVVSMVFDRCKEQSDEEGANYE